MGFRHSGWGAWLLCAATLLFGADHYVNSPGEFQAALTASQSNGQHDVIHAASGVYTLTSTLTYASSEPYHLTILGEGAASTVLDGGGTAQCLQLDNTGSGGITVTGLTVRNGRAESLGGGLAVTCENGPITLIRCSVLNNVSNRSAGGAFLGNLHGDITVDSCLVHGNSLDSLTGDDGAGLDLYIGTDGTGSITLTRSVITFNTIGECPGAVGSPDGAGVFIYHLGSGATITIHDNSISHNTALRGSAGFYLRVPLSAAVLFHGNTVSRNVSGRPGFGVSGGGVHIHLETSTLEFSRNLLLENSAVGPWANGGGLDLLISGPCRILNNVFADNEAEQYGGGAAVNLGAGAPAAVIAGNLFCGNRAYDSGGGLSLNTEGNAFLMNNTYYANTAQAQGGGLAYYAPSTGHTASLWNEVFRGNSPEAIVQFDQGPVRAVTSNIQGGAGQPWFGSGCIDADPLFVNPASPRGGDGLYATFDDGLHLSPDSPSRNTGTHGPVQGVLTHDLTGKDRIQGEAVDMGAYEGDDGPPAFPGFESCGRCRTPFMGAPIPWSGTAQTPGGFPWRAGLTSSARGAQQAVVKVARVR